jgi:hypothetical protein
MFYRNVIINPFPIILAVNGYFINIFSGPAPCCRGLLADMVSHLFIDRNSVIPDILVFLRVHNIFHVTTH